MTKFLIDARSQYAPKFVFSNWDGAAMEASYAEQLGALQFQARALPVYIKLPHDSLHVLT